VPIPVCVVAAAGRAAAVEVASAAAVVVAAAAKMYEACCYVLRVRERPRAAPAKRQRIAAKKNISNMT
jgi:hypothetical protein